MRAILAFLIALPLLAQEPAALLEAKLMERLRQIDQRFPGVMGVAVIDLSTGKTLTLNGDLVTAQASLIKVPVLAAAFQKIEAGALALDQKVELTEKDKAGGSGTLDARLGPQPLTVTVEELLTLMIRDSDNTATNRIIALVGMDSVNQLMAQLGLRATRLRRVMMDSAAAKRNEENTSTPLEMARLFEFIYRERLISRNASRRMVEMLKLVRADFRAALPRGVESASKPGSVPGVRTEAGIVYLEGRPYVLSVMCSLIEGNANPIRDVVEAVHSYFTRISQSNRYGHRVSEPIY
ncbi:MAG: class A beta-lactamase-related serine hydrolase [Bryobacteraceae bacterium]|nr:class A beta-lactamase-related serine hydrolase [Bryobacteraceae bacterium]MCX7605314.1 class A beta-lactamase-related serine hydrolase [Bryobacteraceae bacterium]